MKGKIGLLGAGEFTRAVSEFDKKVLEDYDDPTVLILPTAAGQEDDWQKWIEQGVKHFKGMEVKAEGVELVNRIGANDEKILDRLKEGNVFYLSGGDPGYLLEVLKNSKAWEVIRARWENGASIVGSSAGAMVLGKKVWGSVYQYNDKGVLLPWVEGLGLVEFGVIPHFNVIPEYYDGKQVKEVEGNLPDDVEVVGIDENTGMILSNGEWEVAGGGGVYRDIKKLVIK